eukprot:COSAG01_NODE_17667_length_1132_cov_209.941917_2_plen_245_part_00
MSQLRPLSQLGPLGQLKPLSQLRPWGQLGPWGQLRPLGPLSQLRQTARVGARWHLHHRRRLQRTAELRLAAQPLGAAAGAFQGGAVDVGGLARRRPLHRPLQRRHRRRVGLAAQRMAHLPWRLHPQLCNKNRRDIGTSQSKCTASMAHVRRRRHRLHQLQLGAQRRGHAARRPQQVACGAHAALLGVRLRVAQRHRQLRPRHRPLGTTALQQLVQSLPQQRVIHTSRSEPHTQRPSIAGKLSRP